MGTVRVEPGGVGRDLEGRDGAEHGEEVGSEWEAGGASSAEVGSKGR